MKDFAVLFADLDGTTKTNEKVAALKKYFGTVSHGEAAWAVYFLTGRRIKQLVKSGQLARWAVDEAKIPDWLFDECYDSVGDLGETIALILPTTEAHAEGSLDFWIEEKVYKLRGASELTQREIVVGAWNASSDLERFLFNKLLTGAFRVGVSQQLVVKALSELSGIEPRVISQRLMGDWDPTAEFFEKLIDTEGGAGELSRPYPFYLAFPLTENETLLLGPAANWFAEWKWDGIRAQLIKRNKEIAIWSRGEELLTDRFPEIVEEATGLKEGVVLDGEILPFKEGDVLPFQLLQKRIGRKNLNKKILDEIPVVFMAYDILEEDYKDLRDEPLRFRRERLEHVLSTRDKVASQQEFTQLQLFAPCMTQLSPSLRVSPTMQAESWEEMKKIRDTANAMKVEGLMLKHRESKYGTGRHKGFWWKWKVDPFTIDTVMVAAQPGHGKRAGLFTDYTFAVWQENELVPIAKAYSGLTDEEIRKVDAFVRENTTGRYGPLRTVKPTQVFELAFDGLQPSTRHKSGIALRFPRILRWRFDKKVSEIDTVESVSKLFKEKARD
ncbi:MAG: ATP-dependent DNA ligase [Candidatus Obscuribacterales bacterium]|jgi:DNA ligase-1|nr:ATP-dependent DNA ligase [Candidatus Obscuribacterales bacterium]